MSKFQRDLAERVGRTALQAFLACVATTMAGWTDITSAKAGIVAGIAAALSAAINLACRSIGDPDSGSGLE